MKFPLLKLFKSFINAFKGLKIAVRQQNFSFMLLITAIVLLLAVFLKISYFEWLILILIIGLVLALEVFNTAIENLLDFLNPHISEKVRAIKDLIAGAIVLICFTAFILGLIIFVPKIISLLN